MGSSRIQEVDKNRQKSAGQAWLLDRTAMRSKSFWSFLLGSSVGAMEVGCFTMVEKEQLIGGEYHPMIYHISTLYCRVSTMVQDFETIHNMYKVFIVCQQLLEYKSISTVVGGVRWGRLSWLKHSSFFLDLDESCVACSVHQS